MSAVAEGKAKRKRRSRIPAGRAGARLVMDELLRRGLDARLADGYTNKYDVLIEPYGSPPKPVHVRTVHASPWYVRSSHFVGASAKQVTVYVLLGLEKNQDSEGPLLLAILALSRCAQKLTLLITKFQ